VSPAASRPVVVARSSGADKVVRWPVAARLPAGANVSRFQLRIFRLVEGIVRALSGGQQHHSAFDDRLEQQRQPLDAGAEERRDDADHDRPQKLGHTGAAGRREVRDREREGAEAGPVVEADEDQRADTGSEQPGREHHTEHRTADPGHLHHQERGRKRRAEERADRGETPCRGDHDTGHLRRVALDQVDDEDSEAAADRDQRRLRAKDDPEAERDERCNDDPGELDRRHGSG
jgi:hypothetical protein